MKVIEPGLRYELQNFEDKASSQTLQFIHKEHVAGEPTGSLKTVTDGTTNEELLEVIFDRLRFQHKKLPSRESALAITKVEEAIIWLLRRTQNRKAAGVEGTANPMP